MSKRRSRNMRRNWAIMLVLMQAVENATPLSSPGSWAEEGGQRAHVGRRGGDHEGELLVVDADPLDPTASGYLQQPPVPIHTEE